MMDLRVGEQYIVKANSEHHSGKIGQLEFIGGPRTNCVILKRPINHGKSLFVVGIDDIELYKPVS